MDTKDNYVASMQPHIENDLVISLEERDKTERILNGHCIQSLSEADFGVEIALYLFYEEQNQH